MPQPAYPCAAGLSSPAWAFHDTSCRALGRQCDRDRSIQQRVPEIAIWIRAHLQPCRTRPIDMSLAMVPNYDFERKTPSLDALRTRWPDISINGLPDAFDISSLRFLVVFKSAIGSVDHTYHELRFLLTFPPHPHVIPRPVDIVTKRNTLDGKRGVISFLLLLPR
ncbi:hypothetical protein MFIFM68171_07502 [Madurella fahalii]|uniref:Uncharacterized protein n=1 Tax=Madurella fahalii TaxID=1157608 RepID=A0ABQ0GHT2_9PEZI